MTMMTAPAAHPAPSAPEHLSASDLFRRPILVASDGTPTSLAALRIGASLAHRYEARVHVVAVLDPLLYAMPARGADIGGVVGGGVVGGGAELLRMASTQRLKDVRDQIGDVSGGAEWPVEIRVGAAASYVTSEARANDATMVVVGLRPHSTLDRVFGGETALRVMRQSRVPVLAVVPTLTELPSRVVAAVDFSRSSLRAAHAAASLVADGGTFFLAYVRPPMHPRTEDTEGLGVIYSQGVAAAFARMSAELWLPPRVRVQTVFLEGAPAAELTRFADRSGADLISVGSHRHGMVDRLILGSVTADLVRSAARSLLVCPPSEKRD